MAFGLVEAISTADLRTHLVSVDYNRHLHTVSDNTKPGKDSFVNEGIQNENQHLFDEVKHASGYGSNSNVSSSRPSIKYLNDKQNVSAAKIQGTTHKSAIIQAIPRKVRGPGADQSSPNTSPSYEYISNAHLPPKDYSTGEPTTTIVYATSVPTSRPYVNMRPIPSFPMQKYRLTSLENKQEKMGTPEESKKIFDDQKDNLPMELRKTQLNIVHEKPDAFKHIFTSEQEPTSTATYDSTPIHSEQRKRTYYKNIPNVRVQSDEGIIKMSTSSGNSLPYPYHNHKWSNEDFLTRVVTPPQFFYKNMYDKLRTLYRASPVHHALLQPYPEEDEYHGETYGRMGHLTSNYALQLPTDRQHQTYQPLTIRDFELLLQLLVLRESRISGDVDPRQLLQMYPRVGTDSNLIGSPMHLYGYSGNRDKGMYRVAGQQTTAQLLPPNVREELLYRMLLLALHTQSPPKLIPVPQMHPILSSQYMYFGSSDAKSTSSSHEAFRQRSGSVVKGPVRSVQILGEID